MKALVASLALASLLIPGARSAAAELERFRVVVNADNPAKSLSTAQLDLYFLKKQTTWPDGGTVEPVDQSASSFLRALFTEDVHGRKVSAIRSYWQQQIFSGRGSPPPVMSSDAEVLAFVRMRPNAIGYVSAETEIGDGLKVVSITR